MGLRQSLLLLLLVLGLANALSVALLVDAIVVRVAGAELSDWGGGADGGGLAREHRADLEAADGRNERELDERAEHFVSQIAQDSLRSRAERLETLERNAVIMVNMNSLLESLAEDESTHQLRTLHQRLVQGRLAQQGLPSRVGLQSKLH